MKEKKDKKSVIYPNTTVYHYRASHHFSEVLSELQAKTGLHKTELLSFFFCHCVDIYGDDLKKFFSDYGEHKQAGLIQPSSLPIF